MGKPKMQHCFNCGAELGVYEHYSGEVEVCNEPDCLRAAREHEQGLRENAMLDAIDDDYGRYR